MHRPRRRAAVLSGPPAPRPLPQAWVPRVVNLALAFFLGLLIAPIVTEFGGKPAYVQAALLLVAVPVVLVVVLCLCSAIRPGSLGRAVRRRRRRKAGPGPAP